MTHEACDDFASFDQPRCLQDALVLVGDRRGHAANRNTALAWLRSQTCEAVKSVAFLANGVYLSSLSNGGH